MKASISFILLFIGSLTAIGCSHQSDKPLKGFVTEQTVTTIKTIQPLLSNRADKTVPPSKRKSVVRTYYTEDAYRIDTQVDNLSTIYRFDIKKVIVLDHKNHTYSFSDLPAKAAIKENEVLFIVNPTKKISKVGLYECKNYRVNIRKPTEAIQNICMSDKIEIDYDIYFTVIKKLADFYPEGASLLANILQYGEAFPVEIKSEMAGISLRQKVLTTLVSAENIDIPSSKFEVPEGYTKI